MYDNYAGHLSDPEGTLRISGWGCAARTLERLAYKMIANSSPKRFDLYTLC